MSNARLLAAASLVLALGVMTSACGEDEEEEQMHGFGTCDLRNVSPSCIERHGATPTELASQEEACVDAGGDWSNDSCPNDDLVGCCEYTFGDEFRECFYTGTTRDPVAYCADFDGVWTPAS
jgi:hypothetical protein